MDRPISGRGGRYLQRVDSYPAIALGIDLHLTPATEGGRSLPLLNLSDRTSIYRPNWGLPSMTPPEQSGARSSRSYGIESAQVRVPML